MQPFLSSSPQDEKTVTTSNDIAIKNLNMATPQSPIGRLVNISRIGDISENHLFGRYSVQDVFYFKRFDKFE